MRGFNFGGQTKIAYAQDPDPRWFRSRTRALFNASFFSGIKPEYPSCCIQGSDAHRLMMMPPTTTWDRWCVTGVLLPE
jgi:hypothetical protein